MQTKKTNKRINNALTILLTLITLGVFGQNNPTEEAQPIVAEGKLLYKSEMASWYGTDLFLENYKNRDNIGGYFSYTDHGSSKCVFFSKDDNPKVIGTILFDSTYNIKTAKIDLSEREFSIYETELYVIRREALAEVRTDTLFKNYKNTNLNLIPIINDHERKVYILTGPEQNGVVIFGNDYLIIFDQNNKLISKKQLHKNIIPIYFKPDDESEDSFHSHSDETGQFITATDICTLMLYEKMTKWKRHSVISEKYTSIWYCETNELLVLTNEALDKIYKDQEKRHEKKQE